MTNRKDRGPAQRRDQQMISPLFFFIFRRPTSRPSLCGKTHTSLVPFHTVSICRHR